MAPLFPQVPLSPNSFLVFVYFGIPTRLRAQVAVSIPVLQPLYQIEGYRAIIQSIHEAAEGGDGRCGRQVVENIGVGKRMRWKENGAERQGTIPRGA